MNTHLCSVEFVAINLILLFTAGSMFVHITVHTSVLHPYCVELWLVYKNKFFLQQCTLANLRHIWRSSSVTLESGHQSSLNPWGSLSFYPSILSFYYILLFYPSILSFYSILLFYPSIIGLYTILRLLLCPSSIH